MTTTKTETETPESVSSTWQKLKDLFTKASVKTEMPYSLPPDVLKQLKEKFGKPSAEQLATYARMAVEIAHNIKTGKWKIEDIDIHRDGDRMSVTISAGDGSLMPKKKPARKKSPRTKVKKA